MLEQNIVTKMPGQLRHVELTDAERMFCYKYLETLNVREAYRAVYASDGREIPPGAPQAMAARRHVRAEINRLFDENQGMTAAETVVRLTHHARASVADLGDVTDTGQWRINLKKAVHTGALQAVKKIKIDPDTGLIAEIEMYDAQAALLALAKIHKLFSDTQVNVLHNEMTVNIEAGRNAMRDAMKDPQVMKALMSAAEAINKPVTVSNGTNQTGS